MKDNSLVRIAETSQRNKIIRIVRKNVIVDGDQESSTCNTVRTGTDDSFQPMMSKPFDHEQACKLPEGNCDAVGIAIKYLP